MISSILPVSQQQSGNSKASAETTTEETSDTQTSSGSSENSSSSSAGAAAQPVKTTTAAEAEVARPVEPLASVQSAVESRMEATEESDVSEDAARAKALDMQKQLQLESLIETVSGPAAASAKLVQTADTSPVSNGELGSSSEGASLDKVA